MKNYVGDKVLVLHFPPLSARTSLPVVNILMLSHVSDY